jgi:hypothetical protein
LPPSPTRLLRPLVLLAWRERWWLVAFAALLTLCRVPTIDGWDEAFYVGQLTSAVGDRDLRLQDDVVLVPKRFEEKCRIVSSALPSGALANTFSIGPALLLSPFVTPFVSAASPPPWLPFRAAAAAGAMLLLSLTALACVALLRRLGVPGDVAPLAAGLALLSSPVALYGTRSYLNAHLGGALLVALVLHQAVRWEAERRARNALALGLAVGLATANRWQDALVVLPVLLAAGVAAARSGRPWKAGAALGVAAAALGVAGQLLAWQVQFGTPVLVPQGAGYMRWLAPQVVPLLLSTYHGLLPWAPGLALGLGALVLGLRGDRHRWLFAGMAAAALLALYVSACPEDWWARDSFGPRRLASLAPIAATGLGLLLARVALRPRVLLAGVLGLWSVVAMSAYFSGHDDLFRLVTGRPDPFRPADTVTPAAEGWLNRWGALHAAKPGFSLSDAPRLPDRLVGIAWVALVVGAVRLGWPLLASRAAVQRLAVALALAHVAAWLALLALAPSNRPWNARWAAFLEAPLDPARAAALPDEAAVARDVVVAGWAAATADAGALEQALARLRARGITASPAEAARCGKAAGQPR